MTSLEQHVMTRHDAGLHAEEIAAELGFDVRRTRQIVSRLSENRRDHFEAAVRASSSALLAAIRRHHPEMVR